MSGDGTDSVTLFTEILELTNDKNKWVLTHERQEQVGSDTRTTRTSGF